MIGLALLVVLLIFTPFPRETIAPWCCGIVHIVCLGIFISLLVERRDKGKSGAGWQRLRTPLDIPILVFLVLLALSAAFSIDQKRSFGELLKLIDYLVIYYSVASRCDNQRDINLCIHLIMGMGFFLSVRGIIQYLGGADRSFWLSAKELSGPFDNSNFFAGYLTLVIFPVLGIMAAQVEASKKLLIGYILSTMSVAFTLTLSRGGWASMLVSLAGIGVIFAGKQKIYNQEGYRCNPGFGLLAPVVIPLIIVVGLEAFLLGFQPIYDQASSLFDPKRKKEVESINGRLPVWRASLPIIRDYPLTGAGPGTFPLIHTHYMKKMPAFDAYVWNEYLQLCVEAGPLSLAACLWLITCLVVGCIRAYLKEEDRGKEITLLGILGAILATAIHCLTSPLLHVMANNILLVTLTGIAMSRYFQGERPARGRICDRRND